MQELGLAGSCTEMLHVKLFLDSQGVLRSYRYSSFPAAIRSDPQRPQRPQIPPNPIFPF